ncbi:sigma-54 interaction domain-containing protein [Acetonema longum]|uniref:HTH-type transcriptional regulatory protein TyrR n=1 Tax=Acetonema longum DSM 6540 TaxID=1009370 RepID=F7NGM7_9FIRM|nr:sigma 54-interacting transcriptional regulator [Acetonema longum]EGO64831.1 PAS modulated sigma54 specific transcriptional regulator, Fis family protein [Acetonema longum DSM 6540]
MESPVDIDPSLLLKIIDSSYDGIFITSHEGVILYCNEAYSRISGLNAASIRGQKIEDLVAGTEIPDACSPDVIRTQRPITKMIDYYQGVSALVTSVPVFDSAGSLVWVFSNVRDITELVTLQEQLKSTSDLNAEYQRQLRQIQDQEQNILLANSPMMVNILRLADRVAGVSSPVLIQGEAGVGKDLLARYIHDRIDTPAARPFIHINCSAIPEELLEAELFGYEPGAFSGASEQGKAGLFELAGNGTLFLDEIGEMPLSLQVKLLDVLQTNQVHRVGGTKSIRVNPRIIAATNKQLETLIRENRFRQDLYYRLSVIPIYIPPLRERKEDLVSLISYFLNRKNRKFGMKRRIDSQVIEILSEYPWPGNVRELKNVIERMVVTADGNTIDESCIPVQILQMAGKTHFIATPDYFSTYDLKTILAEVEREVIKKSLAVFGSLRKAAFHLGVDLSTLVRKKKKYNL